MPIQVPKPREKLQRMVQEEQFDQLKEQSLVFSGWQGAYLGVVGLVLKAFAFHLHLLMHLHIVLCGLQVLQKPVDVCIPICLPVQAKVCI